MARLMATSAWTAILAFSVNSGCSGDPAQPQGGTGGGGGGGGSGTTGSSSSHAGSSVASSTAGAGPATGAGGGGGAMPFVCDPPAEAGSIYEQSAESLNIEVGSVPMCQYRGKVMLLVNTAAV